MPVFLDFPIEFFRHLLELLFSVNRCDAVNCDAIGERGFPLAVSLTEVDALARRTWVSLDIPVCIACIYGKPVRSSKGKSNRVPFPTADIRSFCKSA